jgi:hypothetical protein
MLLSCTMAPEFRRRMCGSTARVSAAGPKKCKDGKYSRKFKATKDGSWTATYFGDSTNLRVTAKSDYVDVR